MTMEEGACLGDLSIHAGVRACIRACFCAGARGSVIAGASKRMGFSATLENNRTKTTALCVCNCSMSNGSVRESVCKSVRTGSVGVAGEGIGRNVMEVAESAQV